jgi:SulP family sulfate permease
MIALLEAHRAGLLGRTHLPANLVAGLVVGIVALPLAMAFAIASGARPEQGLYTAIVAGLCTTVFGGTRVQISGPTGAFVAVLAVITAQHGIGGLQVATLMAGLILIGMGAARLGAVIRYIPDPVVVGFTSGIGVVIFVGQWKDFFGLQLPAGGGTHFHEKLVTIATALPTAHLATTGLAVLALVTLIVGTRRLTRVPSPLVAMLLATGLQYAFQFPGVATIGSAFGGIPRELPSLQLPDVDFTTIVQLIGPAFTIALLGAIESLLSATVADGMAGTRHDSNQELVGQGIANVAAPLFGGFAATGAIARTATNIRNGATSPVAGVVHCVFLVAVILVLAPLAVHIPLGALAAILFFVAWNMSDVHRFAHLLKTAPKADVAILVLTFVLTVFTDLVVAVNVGVVLASLVFMRRMAQAVSVEAHSHEDLVTETGVPAALSKDTVVYTIDGPFFFGAAENLEAALRRSQSHVRTLVIRMGRVPFMDATGLTALDEIVEDFQRTGARVVLVEVRANVREKLERARIVERVGAGGIHDTLADYLAYASNAPPRPDAAAQSA